MDGESCSPEPHARLVLHPDRKQGHGENQDTRFKTVSPLWWLNLTEKKRSEESSPAESVVETWKTIARHLGQHLGQNGLRLECFGATARAGAAGCRKASGGSWA